MIETKLYFVAAVFIGIATFALAVCTPQERQAVNAGEKATCSIIQAFENAAVDTLCATAPEVTQIVEDITAARLAKNASDSGTRVSVIQPGCTYIPNTNLCATYAELAPALKRLRASRLAAPQVPPAGQASDGAIQ